jgi:hypothetical protein
MRVLLLSLSYLFYLTTAMDQGELTPPACWGNDNFLYVVKEARGRVYAEGCLSHSVGEIVLSTDRAAINTWKEDTVRAHPTRKDTCVHTSVSVQENRVQVAHKNVYGRVDNTTFIYPPVSTLATIECLRHALLVNRKYVFSLHTGALLLTLEDGLLDLRTAETEIAVITREHEVRVYGVNREEIVHFTLPESSTTLYPTKIMALRYGMVVVGHSIVEDSAIVDTVEVIDNVFTRARALQGAVMFDTEHVGANDNYLSLIAYTNRGAGKQVVTFERNRYEVVDSTSLSEDDVRGMFFSGHHLIVIYKSRLVSSFDTRTMNDVSVLSADAREIVYVRMLDSAAVRHSTGSLLFSLLPMLVYYGKP